MGMVEDLGDDLAVETLKAMDEIGNDRFYNDVARVIGVKTVAEHVDRQAVLDHLRELGVDFAQGYLLHKPEPLAHLLGLPSPAIASAAPALSSAGR